MELLSKASDFLKFLGELLAFWRIFSRSSTDDNSDEILLDLEDCDSLIHEISGVLWEAITISKQRGFSYERDRLERAYYALDGLRTAGDLSGIGQALRRASIDLAISEELSDIAQKLEVCSERIRSYVWSLRRPNE